MAVLEDVAELDVERWDGWQGRRASSSEEKATATDIDCGPSRVTSAGITLWLKSASEQHH
jgi:hypothetical protein